MIELLFVTFADRKRPGLTYKISFEDQTAYDKWVLEHSWFVESREAVFHDEAEANTATVNLSDNFMTIKYSLTWGQVLQMLQSATEMPYYPDKPGRPEARVLVCNTSRERRLWKMPKVW